MYNSEGFQFYTPLQTLEKEIKRKNNTRSKIKKMNIKKKIIKQKCIEFNPEFIVQFQVRFYSSSSFIIFFYIYIHTHI